MEAYIYTYVNRENLKTYIGSRCAYKGTAEDDFNIKYFSSSKNPEFILDMQNNKLDGNIILKINCENSKSKIVEIEHKLIKAYWDKFGKENSYNRYCNGKFYVNGLHVHPGKNFRNGIKQSIEHRKKISEALKGNKSRKGLHHSKEAKQKISESNKGKKHNYTPESKKAWQEKMIGRIPWNKGVHGVIHMSEITKQKISQYNTGKKWPPEFGKKVSDAKKGKSPLKFKWITPDGNIKIMDKSKVALWHKDWVLYDETPIKTDKQKEIKNI